MKKINIILVLVVFLCFFSSEMAEAAGVVTFWSDPASPITVKQGENVKFYFTVDKSWNYPRMDVFVSCLYYDTLGKYYKSSSVNYRDFFKEREEAGDLYTRTFSSVESTSSIEPGRVECAFHVVGEYRGGALCISMSETVVINIKSPNSSDKCPKNTCPGNYCYNAQGTKVEGTRDSGCATATAYFQPNSVTPKTVWTKENTPSRDEIAFLTWEAHNASKLEVECQGVTPIERSSIQISSADWYKSQTQYTAPSGWTKDAYPAWFYVGAKGTETCTFYPINSDGTAGTPASSSVTVNQCTCHSNIPSVYSAVQNNQSGCLGTKPDGAKEVIEDSDCCGTGLKCYTCPSGTKWDQVKGRCSSTTSTGKGETKTVCKPDDPNCAARTCKDRYCWNGCELVRGTSNDCD